MTTDEQTAALDALRERLQSIAILAVTAQERLGNPDTVDELLLDIRDDLAVAQTLNNRLQA